MFKRLPGLHGHMGSIQTFFVPFDGSDLAETALERAVALGDGVTADVVAATVIPHDRNYARDRGWLDDGESFDADHIEGLLRQRVAELAPGAEFRCLTVDAHVSSGGIATRIRDMANDADADVVFLGSENVGSVAAPVSSIGSNVAKRVPYDIYLVQS